MPIKTFTWPAQPLDKSGLATEAKQDAQIVLETSMDTSLNNIEADIAAIALVDFATEAKQDTQITELQSINTELDTQTSLLSDIESDTTLIESHTDDTATNTSNLYSLSNSHLPKLDNIDTKLGFIQSTLEDTIQADASALPPQATVIAGKDASNNVKIPLVESDGSINVKVNSSGLPTGAATEAKQDTQITELQDINTELNSQTTVLNSMDTKLDDLSNIYAALTTLEGRAIIGVVDQIDSTPLLDTSSTNIPASSSLPVQVVASLNARTFKIITVEDIGEFIGLYTGAPSSEVLNCVLPLGGGEVEVDIPLGSRISLRAMKNAAVTSGFIAINFLG